MSLAKKSYLISIVVLAFFIISCRDQQVIHQGRLLGVNQSFEPATIPELNTLWESHKEIVEIPDSPKNHNINIAGYIVKAYTCPSCPIGAQCKPCMGNNIVVSETNALRQTYDGLSSSEFILYTDQPTQFELGKKYLFSIAMENGKYPALIGYGPARTH